MVYFKRFLLLFLLLNMLFFCGCEAKETVMLQAENEQIKCTSSEDAKDIFNDEEPKEVEVEHELASCVYVYISGEVVHPGVYQMVEDARIYEVLMEAGGYTEDADTIVCNLAEKVSDGMQIHIPNKNIVSDSNKTQIDVLEDSNGKVDLNSASQTELTEIPGIGTVKAEAIISYRDEHGRFRSTEDVMQVEGIKDGTYEKIKEYITVRN